MPRHILPVIIFSQFACTSLWFAGNAVMGNLSSAFDLPEGALGDLTSIIQLGFIAGTLVFAILTIADRFPPSKVFFICALAGAAFNLGITGEGNSFTSLLTLRFLTGFCLAGIYPVGMKIAADYFEKGLGTALGWLVGALVFGTAFPHFLQAFTGDLSWHSVIIGTSLMATCGGLLMLFLVPSGPHRRASAKPDLSAFFKVFRNKKFRRAAFGYFGHMWELYAFWTFVPSVLIFFGNDGINISLWSFCIIAGGGIACIVGGYLSLSYGAKRVALTALTFSGICCLISPIIFLYTPTEILLLFLLFWGAVVVTDSPLFSTLVAGNAPPDLKGTALTVVNCLGFALTVVSIQFLNFLMQSIAPQYLLLFLAAGPLFGVLSGRLEKGRA